MKKKKIHRGHSKGYHYGGRLEEETDVIKIGLFGLRDFFPLPNFPF